MSSKATPMQMLEITSQEARDYGDQGLILDDLQGVVECCDRLLALIERSSEDVTLLEALTTSALIKYVRCFGSGKRSHLREEDMAELLGDPVGVHRYFKDIRDKHIAHSVSPLEQVRVGVFVNRTRERSGRRSDIRA